MAYKKIYYIILTAFLLTSLSACKDQWEEHTELNDAVLKENILQPINSNPELSRFAEYLKKTGYDQLLTSSKLFTVWAPTNAALDAIDPAIVNNADKLKEFIGNHISYQQYYTYTPNPSMRIKAISGKYLLWDRSANPENIEGATVVQANKQYGNGVLHVINKIMPPKPDSWEYMNSLNVGQRQTAFVNSLTFNFFDPKLAEQVGVNPTTGAPVYKEGTGIISRNTFIENVRDLKHEDSLNTYIILTDEAYEQEYNKIQEFYVDSITQVTNYLRNWNVVKDLAFDSLYTPGNLPDTLVSRFGVKIPIDKNAIVSSYRTSNGMVYVMNRLGTRVQDKIRTRIIEAETARRPQDFKTDQRNDRIHYRYRANASGQQDLRVYDHGDNNGIWVKYVVRNLPKATYKIYMKATKDFGTADLTQRVAIGDVVQTTTFPYVTIPMNSTEEVYVGDYTLDQYGDVTLYVVSNKASGADLNPIVLDYIKMVPVL